MHRVNGAALWANLHLLFWLSLVPFTTAWMGENRFPPVPTAVYGIALLVAAIAYYVLQTILLRVDGEQSRLAHRHWPGPEGQGFAAPVLRWASASSFVNQWAGIAIYVVVALMWLVPDRRVERTLTAAHGGPGPASTL